MIPILHITGIVLALTILVTAYMIFTWPEPKTRALYINQARHFVAFTFLYAIGAVVTIIGATAFAYASLYLLNQLPKSTTLLQNIEAITYMVLPFYVYILAKHDLNDKL